MDHVLTMSTGDWGRCLSLPITLAIVTATVWFLGRFAQPSKLPSPAQIAGRRGAIDLSRYVCPPHQHLIDFDRSPLLVRDDGSVLAQCCMQGCDITVTIGRNIAGLEVELPVKESHL